MPDYDELYKMIVDLKREFEDHKHTGLDSQLIDTTIQNQGTITIRNTATIDTTYSAEEGGVIANNRTRIQDIETALKNVGILS